MLGLQHAKLTVQNFGNFRGHKLVYFCSERVHTCQWSGFSFLSGFGPNSWHCSGHHMRRHGSSLSLLYARQAPWYHMSDPNNQLRKPFSYFSSPFVYPCSLLSLSTIALNFLTETVTSTSSLVQRKHLIKSVESTISCYILVVIQKNGLLGIAQMQATI